MMSDLSTLSLLYMVTNSLKNHTIMNIFTRAFLWKSYSNWQCVRSFFFLTGTNVDTHHRICKWRFFLHDQTHNFLVYDKTSRFSDLVVQFGFDLFIIMATRVVFSHKIMIEDTGLFVMLHNRYFSNGICWFFGKNLFIFRLRYQLLFAATFFRDSPEVNWFAVSNFFDWTFFRAYYRHSRTG